MIISIYSLFCNNTLLCMKGLLEKWKRLLFEEKKTHNPGMASMWAGHQYILIAPEVQWPTFDRPQLVNIPGLGIGRPEKAVHQPYSRKIWIFLWLVPEYIDVNNGQTLINLIFKLFFLRYTVLWKPLVMQEHKDILQFRINMLRLAHFCGFVLVFV